MADAVFTYTPPAGYTTVTLSGSVVADGQFTVQPAVGDQIAFPTGLTVSTQLEMSGDYGTYTVYHITAAGTVYTVSYAYLYQATVQTSLLAPAGLQSVTLTSWAGDAVFPVTPVTGNQIIGDAGLTINANGTITGNTGFYPITLVTGSHAYTVTYSLGVFATNTFAYVPPAGYSSVTLAGIIETNNQFTVQPIAGDQILYPPGLIVGAGLTIGGVDGTYTLYHVTAAGTVYHISYVQALSVPITVETTLLPPAGISSVTLTGWTGTLTFPVTPVTGNQLLYPTGLTVGTTGEITGDVGSYLVTLNTGSNVYSVQHVISPPASTTGTSTFNLVPIDNHAVVTLAEGFSTYLFEGWTAGTPAVGWQIVYPTISNTVINNLAELQTDSLVDLDVWVVDLTGTWYGLQVIVSGVSNNLASDVTTQTTLVAPEGWQFVALEANYDTYLISDWPAQDLPVAGDLVGIQSANGSINSLFELTTDIETVDIPIAIIRQTGSVDGGSIDSTGLTVHPEADVDFTLNRQILNSFSINGVISPVVSLLVQFDLSAQVTENALRTAYSTVQLLGSAELEGETARVVPAGTAQINGSASIELTGIAVSTPLNVDMSATVIADAVVNGVHELELTFTLSSQVIESGVRFARSYASISGSLGVTASALRVLRSNATLLGRATSTTVEPLIIRNGLCTFSVAGTLTANSVIPQVTDSVVFQAGLTSVIAPTRTTFDTATFIGTTDVEASGFRTIFGESNLLGSFDIEADALLSKGAEATLLISGNLTATGLRSVQPTVILSGSAELLSETRLNLTLPAIAARTFKVSRPSRVMYTTG